MSRLIALNWQRGAYIGPNATIRRRIRIIGVVRIIRVIRIGGLGIRRVIVVRRVRGIRIVGIGLRVIVRIGSLIIRGGNK